MRNLNIKTIAKNKKDYNVIIGKKFEDSEDMFTPKENTRNSFTSLWGCSLVCCPN